MVSVKIAHFLSFLASVFVYVLLCVCVRPRAAESQTLDQIDASNEREKKVRDRSLFVLLHVLYFSSFQADSRSNLEHPRPNTRIASGVNRRSAASAQKGN